MPGSPLKLLFELCAKPLAYGSNDCCTVVSDCVADHYGFDVMASYRGRYSTSLGFLRLFKKYGCSSLQEWVGYVLSTHGFVETDNPSDFDIGMIEVRFDGETVNLPAFYYHGMWHGRSDTGVLVMKKASIAWQRQ